MTAPVLSSLRTFFQSMPSRTVWAALSGGMDSCVLLDALVVLRESLELSIHAIHVNHQLHAQAGDWQQHCEQLCAAYAVPLKSIVIDVPLSPGDSVEAEARACRYRCFQQHVPSGAALLLAHHQADQAETFLLQLLRGAGVKGLAAMPVTKPLGELTLHRPLLEVPQSDIATYAAARALTWVDDPSNAMTHYARNYLRHQVMPALTQRWPSVSASVGRSARLCAEADQLLDELAQVLYQKCQLNGRLQVDAVNMLSAAKQRLLLRYWITRSGFPLPSEVVLHQLQTSVLMAVPDAMPVLAWPGGEVRRYQGQLFLQVPLSSHDPLQVISWPSMDASLSIEPLGVCLEATMAQGDGVRIPAASTVSVRFRQGGEVIALSKAGGRSTLKKLFQQWQVPPWLRDRVPLLYVDDVLVAVIGYVIAIDYQANDQAPGWVVAIKNAP